MRNGFRILLIMIAVLIAAGIGIISPDSALSKMIHANVSNRTAMELAMVMSSKSHLRIVRGIVLRITDDSIFIFDRDTNSKQNYIINNETKKLPNLLRKGYLVILEIIPGSNIVRSIKIVERPQ